MEFVDEPKKATVSLNLNAKELLIRKTYFYEIGGRVEAVEEAEAWELHRKGLKQIGVSDGSKYAQAIRESRELFKTQGIELAQERLRKGFDEELESARGHFETPPNNDIFGTGALELKQRISKYK